MCVKANTIEIQKVQYILQIIVCIIENESKYSNSALTLNHDPLPSHVKLLMNSGTSNAMLTGSPTPVVWGDGPYTMDPLKMNLKGPALNVYLREFILTELKFILIPTLTLKI